MKSVKIFAQGLNQVLQENNVNAHLAQYGSMMSIRFRKETVLNYADAQEAAGGELYSKFFHYLLNAGIYLPPADLEAFFVSAAHTKKDLNDLANNIAQFFKSNE